MVLVSGKIECFSRIFSFLSPLPRHDWEAIRNIATGQSWISCIPISNILYPSPYLGPISQSHTGARRGVFFCSRIKPDLNAPGVTPDLTAPPYFEARQKYWKYASSSPQVNSLPPQVKCENKWGGKEFTWGGKKITTPDKKSSALPWSHTLGPYTIHISQSQILGKKTDIHHLISAGYLLVADITAYRSNCTSVQCRRQGCIGKNFFLNILYKKIVVQL